jgi:hypothetical protein
VPALQFNRVQGSGNASSRSSSETVCAVSRSLRELLAAILLVCEKNSVKHECDEGWPLRNQVLGTEREKSNSDLNPLEINTAENLHRTASQTSNDLLFALHGLYVPKPLNYDVICQSVDEVQDNRLTVERTDGSERTYDPRRQQGVSVYREEERAFSIGDRVQLTAPARELHVANRELGTIISIGEEKRIGLKMDDGRQIEIDANFHPHLDHGYAVTSHSSQGQTAERVLVHVDTELGAKDLLNNRMAYVAVSRGAHDAQLFTNDREKLPAALGHDVSHQSAHSPEIASSKPVQQEIAPKQEYSYGHGISL